MATGHKITAAQKRDITRLRESGLSIEAIADKLGIGISTVHRHAPEPAVPYQRTFDASDIAKVRQLRSKGMKLEDIVERTGMNLTSVHRYTKDVPVPKTPEKVRIAARTYNRTQRDLARQDTLDNYPSNTERPPSYGGDIYAPTIIPTDPTPYDRSGLLPDPKLVVHCQDILSGYIAELEAGQKRFPNDPTYVTQARYIWLHAWEVWNYEWFLNHNQAWRSIREMANMTASDFSTRVGISGPSIIRYEKGQRNPDPRRLQELHRVYVSVHEEALTKLEASLTLLSMLDAHENSPIWQDDDSPHERKKKRAMWLAGMTSLDDEDENLTIEHFTHLAPIRALMPHPDWRVATNENWHLIGYG